MAAELHYLLFDQLKYILSLFQVFQVPSFSLGFISTYSEIKSITIKITFLSKFSIFRTEKKCYIMIRIKHEQYVTKRKAGV